MENQDTVSYSSLKAYSQDLSAGLTKAYFESLVTGVKAPRV